MRFLGLGRRTGTQGFNYIPQFYDEKKEKLENFMKDYDTTDDESLEAMKARIKMGYTSRPYYYDKNNTASKIRRKSNIRILIIIAVLLLLVIFGLGSFGHILQEMLK
jgi:hypothetical protein